MSTQPRLLFDTHVVLWWLADHPTLSHEIKVLIDEEVEVFVSAATVWEVAIKQAAGKIESPVDLAERIRDSEMQHLSITADHAIEAGRLPLIHRDPFDRMLIAQARFQGLTLVTRDETVHQYDVTLLRA
ncbi:type II toxin-antitoxin system VapC family toxin [soil metagenome]